MMNKDKYINKIEVLALKLMTKHELYGWKLSWNKQRTAFATCCKVKKEISLSSILMPIQTIKFNKNVILHEIAHALVGNQHNHNKVWKEKAIEIGCDGKFSLTGKSPKSKYAGACPNCGSKQVRHRLSKDMIDKSLICIGCRDKFGKTYYFKWFEN